MMNPTSLKKKVMITTSRILSLNIIEEPSLEFRYGQRVIDPRVGLSVFGPIDSDLPNHPRNVSYGLVGTEQGIAKALGFLNRSRTEIISKEYQKNNRLWIPFPGFQAAFNSQLPAKPTKVFQLNSDQLVYSSNLNEPNERAFKVVNNYIGGVEYIKNSEDEVDVIICIVPDIVYKNCRPKSKVSDGVGEKIDTRTRRQRASGQTDLFGSYDVGMYRYSVDFRRQLKARAMVHEIPVQLVLESTLEIDEEKEVPKQERKSPLSDRAWNILTTLYYKAGGKPWKLSTSRDGVCYVGIVYRRVDFTRGNRTACSAAQMFLDTGDGVVVRGDFGPWYSEENNQFHLSKEAAKSLLKKVLSTYGSLEGKPLKEVFLHYRAWLNDEEYEGFKDACPTDVKLVCIRIRQVDNEFRLYREGTRPVLRGTMLKASDTKCFLYTSGYKPFLETYDGWETPQPLRIDIQYGDEDINQVATDILGLTKLNFNACRLGQSNPVTIDFSDAVGEILVSNPAIKEANPRFKFYI